MAAGGLPSDDAIVALFEQLRGEGYRLVPHQLEAGLALLRQARAEDVPPERLVTLLTPVLATSAVEQDKLRRRLASWLGPLIPGRIEDRPLPPPVPEVVRRGRAWPVVAAVAALVTLALLAVYVGGQPQIPLPIPPPVPVITPATMPVTVPVTAPAATGTSGMPETKTETITTVFIITNPVRGVLRWGAVLVPVALFGGWILLRWRWRRQWDLHRRSGDAVKRAGELDLLDLGHRIAGTALFAGPEMSATAQQWRRHLRVPTRDLDPERTVAATIAEGGLFTPVFVERPIAPEYVVAVEALSRHDHLARIADVALDRLVAEGVPIERYYYAGALAHLRPAGGTGAGFSLADLAAAAPHRGLVVIGNGDGLFAPLSAHLDKGTAEALEGWERRAFLSLRPIGDWADRELALLDSGLALGTASRDGLRALGAHVAAGHPAHGRLLEGVLVDRGGPSAAAKPPTETGKAPIDPPPPPSLLPPGTVFRDSDAAWCPEMVVIPAGSFTMGSPADEPGRDTDEGPQHEVHVPSFAVGRYAVTFAEWEACVAAGGCGGYQPKDAGWGRGRRPVIRVSWEDAQAYVQWLSRETGQGYRLLSESEWEYAARAGTTTPFHTGPTITTAQANFDGNGTYNGSLKGEYRGKTVEVGRFPANGFGLHDMHGNVWEWVEDCWHDNYSGAPEDGSTWTSGKCEYRVLRGGSWSYGPDHLRSANRNRSTPVVRLNDYGFRVARTLTP